MISWCACVSCAAQKQPEVVESENSTAWITLRPYGRALATWAIPLAIGRSLEVWRRGWRRCLLRRWLGLPAGRAPRSGRRLASPAGVFGSFGTSVTGNQRRRRSRMARGGGRRGVLLRLAPGLAVAGDPGGLHRAGGGARGLVFLSAACGVCSGREGIPLRCGLGASFSAARGELREFGRPTSGWWLGPGRCAAVGRGGGAVSVVGCGLG
jgi:hypothetical protein